MDYAHYENVFNVKRASIGCNAWVGEESAAHFGTHDPFEKIRLNSGLLRRGHATKK